MSVKTKPRKDETMNAREKLKAIVESARGDDLERAERNWAGLSEHTLRREHGGSGESLRQHLESFRQERREWQAAKDLLDSLLTTKDASDA